jgi:hypothetical protein
MRFKKQLKGKGECKEEKSAMLSGHHYIYILTVPFPKETESIHSPIPRNI